MFKSFLSFFFVLYVFFSWAVSAQENLQQNIDSVYEGLDNYVSERVAKIPKVSFQWRQADRIWRWIEMSLIKKMRLWKESDVLMYQVIQTKVKERKSSYLTHSTSDLIKQWELINAINNYRKVKNLPTLRYNSKLAQMAHRHAKDLSDNFPYDVDNDGIKENISHVGSDGTRVVQRAEDIWYIYSFLAENVAYNQVVASQVAINWKESLTHYEKIIAPKAKEIGVAKVWLYWVMVVWSQKENL